MISLTSCFVGPYVGGHASACSNRGISRVTLLLVVVASLFADAAIMASGKASASEDVV